MNKQRDFQAMDDETLEETFRLYQGLSGMRVDNDRSMYHRYLYRAYGEIVRRKGKVKDEKSRNLHKG